MSNIAIAGSGGMASGAGREMAGSGDAVTGVKSGAYSGLLASLRLKQTLRLLLVHSRLGSEADCRYDISYPRTSPDSRG
jgi:hypothetical protein